MNKNMLYKAAVVVAALALGSTAVSTDALAQRGGHGGGGGAHFGGGGAHFGGGGAHFGGGGRMGGGPIGGIRGGRAFAHRGPVRGFGFAAPYYFGTPYYDDYACWPYQYNRPWNYTYCY
jgi:hypothetical protein